VSVLDVMLRALDDKARRSAALDSAMHSVWLHGYWRFLTRKMTTEEREAAASAVERHNRTQPPDDRTDHTRTGLRWWSE